MASQTGSTLQIPDFNLMSSTGRRLSFESFRGKLPLVLAFVDDLASAAGRDLITRLDGRLVDFGTERSQVLIVSDQSVEAIQGFSAAEQLSVPILSDPDGHISGPLALPADLRVVVADKEGRIREGFSEAVDIDAVLEEVRGFRGGTDGD